MDPQTPKQRDYPEEVRVLEVDGREIVLVGTAHVSKESADLVRQVISRESPDAVCLELDAQRYEALSQQKRWEELDLKQVIRRRQLSTLLVNLLLASYQRRIGLKLGIMPGTELLEAARAADEHGIPVSLCDRHIRITMLRAWRSMSLWQKMKLFSGLLAGMFEDVELSEEDLRKLRRKDLLSELMEELSGAMPHLKRVLIDERDTYLAQKIRDTPGKRLVAVVGAGHLEGIVRTLASEGKEDLQPIEAIPRAAPIGRWLGWGIPIVILGSLAVIAWTKGGSVAGQNLVYWILANGIPSGLGAVLALAHPLTILVAFLAAPITSLTPVIGAGYVTAFVQAWVQPPRVRDFQNVTQEAGSLGAWWRNRLLRVFLAFVLPSLGSVIGTWIGGYEIVSNLV